MAGPTTLDAVPTAVYAGDTFLLSLPVADYPASDGWTVTLSFRGITGSAIDATSTQDGQSPNHLISVDAGTTAAWVADTYSAVAKATKSGAVQTFWRGTMEVRPDLSQQASSFDNRGFYTQCLDKIKEAIKKRSSGGAVSGSIAGVSISRMSVPELWLFHDRLLILAQQEADKIKAEQARKDGRSPNNIGIQFSFP